VHVRVRGGWRAEQVLTLARQPKFFKALKDTNQAAEVLTRDVRRLIEAVKAFDLDSGAKVVHSMVESPLSKLYLDGISGFLTAFAKSLQELQKDCKEEEITKRLQGECVGGAPPQLLACSCEPYAAPPDTSRSRWRGARAWRC
jgi:hypothetical protein